MFAVIKVVRSVSKIWVVGLVACGMASGAFGDNCQSYEVRITNADMPAIEMEGNNVVKGKDYPIVVSYETKCNGSSCVDQKIRLSVTQSRPFSRCFPSSDFENLPVNILEQSFAGPHKLQYHNGSEAFTLGQWASFFDLSDSPVQTQTATVTLGNIQQKIHPPGFPDWYPFHWGVIAEYRPNADCVCWSIKEVDVNTVVKDKVSISGLENAPLNKEGTFTLNNVCVYSSNGWAALHFDSRNSSGSQKFQLKQSGSNSDTIPYEIKVKSKTTHQEGTISTDGYVEDFWNVDGTDLNASDECIGTPNMSFTIQAEISGNETSGYYEDTIQVTVEPR